MLSSLPLLIRFADTDFAIETFSCTERSNFLGSIVCNLCFVKFFVSVNFWRQCVQ